MQVQVSDRSRSALTQPPALSQASSTPFKYTKDARPSHRIGLDANQPIDPRTGRIQPQVSDPDIIASSGAGWVRLNFILGPWAHPKDRASHDGRTWAQTYRQIITGFREKGLRIYGLVGVEAMPTGPGDRFRSRPTHADASDAWLDQYVAHFSAIVEQFHQEVESFESVNEPDDFHGQNRNWIHAGWFAIILQRVYTAVRTRPELDQVRLVSGPLQGLQINNNGAVYYLYSTYQAGKRFFGWGEPGKPFPFDGIGYHIYVNEGFNPDRAQQDRAIRTTYRRYLDAMHRLIRQEEGRDKPLYVSEMGFNSRIEAREVQRRETFQADSLRVGLESIAEDPLVELGVWFCTQDFQTRTGDKYYGLYRLGEPAPHNRKPAFYAFRMFCAGATDETGPQLAEYTNQQIIDAFYSASIALGLANRWSLLSKAGLNLGDLAAARNAIYGGTPVQQLPRLDAKEKAFVLEALNAEPLAETPHEPEPMLLAARVPGKRPAENVHEGGGANPDLTLALQEYTIQQLQQNNELLEAAMARLSGRDYTLLPTHQILIAVGIVSFLVAVVVSVLTVLLASALLP